ncbi:MAG: lamin tail domain-containing protein [Patescibacteria group bacterium]
MKNRTGKISILIFTIFNLWAIFSYRPCLAAEPVLLINEIYYHPSIDSADEWVELYNAGDVEVNLKGWTIADNTAEDTLSSADLLIPPRYYVLIAKSNSIWAGWSPDLASPPANLIFIELNSSIGNGLGNSGDNLQLSDGPGTTVDALSWDEDKTFFDLVGAAKGHSLERLDPLVDTDTAADFIERPLPSPGRQYTKPSYSDDIIITEILPEPADGADNEFIEIYNRSTAEVDLGGWKIDDIEGGSSPYTLPATTILPPGTYLVFYNSQTGVALNDSGDTARLLDPLGEMKAEVSYGQAQRGQSYALFGQDWQWTLTLTSGAVNVFELPENDEEGEAEPAETMSVSEAREGEETDATLTGTVTAPPGTLSDQYFYLEDHTGGMQIYSYHKDFPALKSGDRITVSGTLSEANSERRLKTVSQADIAVNDSGDLPPPTEIAIANIGEKDEGRYIKIKGKVTAAAGATFRVGDGAQEIKVIIRDQTGIQKPRLRRGDEVEIAGILSQYQGEYRLLPWRQEDVKIVQLESETESELAPSGADEWAYLVITIILFILWNLLAGAKKKLPASPLALPQRFAAAIF